MKDKIEKIGNSIIQHGKNSNRVYIMKFDKQDFEEIIQRAENLCKINTYSKIFVKVPKKFCKALQKKGFVIEAEIPKFYKGMEDGIFLGKYFDDSRKEINNLEEINTALDIVDEKKQVNNLKKLDSDYAITDLYKENVNTMAELYKQTFKSYPFPIFDPNYIKKTMDENIYYAGIWYKNKLISIASAETYPESSSVEMTDFATLPNYRGKNLSLYLLKYLEARMSEQDYQTAYTIARAKSIGMNATFKKRGYKFSGILKNNTNISGSIESMTVWYKHL